MTVGVTFDPDTPQSICCSGRSPEPPALRGCRSSGRTRRDGVKNHESTTPHFLTRLYIQSAVIIQIEDLLIR